MPSFFRSGNTSTSDDESTSDESDENFESRDLPELDKTNSIEQELLFEDEHDDDGGSLFRTQRVPEAHDTGVLLHSLLEQLCVSKALNHFHVQQSGHSAPSRIQQYTEYHPDVRTYAAANYRSLSAKLSSRGLIPTVPQNEKNQELRDAYSQGFQLLWDQEPKPRSKFSGKDVVLSNTNTKEASSTSAASIATVISTLPLALQELISHPFINTSQYQRDFDEIGLLGKGGYGKVYHVQKRIDRSSYAVKKISLSQARLQKLHDRGECELDSLLIELRTLAKLNHPNIVRYYNGWLELPQVGPTFRPAAISRQNRPRMLELPGFTSDTSEFFDSLVTTSESGISELEMRGPSYNGPGVDMYLQMDLLPFTLTDYLKQHCFHPRISLQLLLAILDGVEYLHSQDIIHRDLKPDNIFLAAHATPYPGCVDLVDCRDCIQGKSLSQLDRIRPLIGDFGLVTKLAHEGRMNAPDSEARLPAINKVVGTELYVPSGRCTSSENLDLFAIGVIAFELLWRFGTKMERVEVLLKLKQGELPLGFADKCGGGAVEQLIRSILCGEAELTCAKLRERVGEILRAPV